MGVFEDQAQSAFIHCLSLDVCFKMLREAKLLFGQFSMYMRGPRGVTLTLQAQPLIR